MRTDFRLRSPELLSKLHDLTAGEVWASYSISMPLFLHRYKTDGNGLDPEELLN